MQEIPPFGRQQEKKLKIEAFVLMQTGMEIVVLPECH
jgi:hypothetical protein